MHAWCTYTYIYIYICNIYIYIYICVCVVMKYMMNIYVIYNFVNNEVLDLYISWKHRSEGWATHISHPCVLLDAPEIPGMHNPHMASSQKSPLKSDENKWLGISMVYLWYIYGVCRNCSILEQCQEFKHAQNISKLFGAISCNCKLLQRKVGRKDFFAQLLTCEWWFDQKRWTWSGLLYLLKLKL